MSDGVVLPSSLHYWYWLLYLNTWYIVRDWWIVERHFLSHFSVVILSGCQKGLDITLCNLCWFWKGQYLSIVYIRSKSLQGLSRTKNRWADSLLLQIRYVRMVIYFQINLALALFFWEIDLLGWSESHNWTLGWFFGVKSIVITIYFGQCPDTVATRSKH